MVSRQAWQDRARQTEAEGWSTLLVADHLGMGSAFAGLVSAADVTTTLRLGTLVVNNDLHHPLRLAQEAATVDLLSDGRLELGVGSGWAKPEYDLLGIRYDPARVRAGRLAAAIAEMKRAWRGEPVLAAGPQRIPAVPAPRQRPHPPLLVGGHGDAILTLAATEADIIGFTGLTWAGSGLEPSGAGVDAIAERVDFVRGVAGARFDALELNILLQAVAVGDGASAEADRLSNELGMSRDAVLASPITLVGSVTDVVDKLVGLRERLGLSYFVAFGHAAPAMAPVVAHLAGH